MKADSYNLSQAEWQWFVTLTFEKVVSERVRACMWFSWVRELADRSGIHAKKILWILRIEAGESTGRLHFHALLSGMPVHTLNRSFAFMSMALWERLGGGMARVRPYNPGLDGLGYLLKGCDDAFASQAKNFYECSKFGMAPVTLSISLIRALTNRLADDKGETYGTHPSAQSGVRRTQDKSTESQTHPGKASSAGSSLCSASLNAGMRSQMGVDSAPDFTVV